MDINNKGLTSIDFHKEKRLMKICFTSKTQIAKQLYNKQQIFF